jgi:hypothetical protein
MDRRQPFPARPRLVRAAALGAVLLALLPVIARAEPPGRDLTGVWRMVRPNELTSPEQRTPPIPPPRLTPAYAHRFDAQQAAMRAAEAEGRPIARDRDVCVPDGMPKMMTTDSPLEILQTPGQVTIITEFMSQTRRIRLGGAHPPPDELPDGFFGDSIAEWDGDTLVVDTVGFKARTRLFNEAPHSPALRIVERFRLIGPDLLEDEMTLTDPEVLEKPWVVRRVFLRRPDLQIGESICTENNHNYRDADGRLATRLPGDR